MTDLAARIADAERDIAGYQELVRKMTAETYNLVSKLRNERDEARIKINELYSERDAALARIEELEKALGNCVLSMKESQRNGGRTDWSQMIEDLEATSAPPPAP
jgi:uncharacterized coiled-coil DUF342 family protein